MERLPPAFEGLARYRQFIVYLITPSLTRPGKSDKTPINPFTRYPVNPLDSEKWFSADDAIKHAAAIGHGAGVGFVLTHQDPFFFVDIDECLVDGKWSPLATQLTEYFKGAAIEISQSGRGLHIIGSGLCPPHGCKNSQYHLELYTEARFCALTGEFAEGSADANMTDRLPWLVDTFFSKAEKVAHLEWSHTPVPEWNGPWDDDVLIAKAISTAGGAQVFGNKCTFQQLFEADHDALARVYPDSGGQGRPYDESSADMALALHLAFWTGKNQERMKNIMLRSSLSRDKWNREKYLHDTIQNACATCTDVYSISYKPGGKIAPQPAAVHRDPAHREPIRNLAAAATNTLPEVATASLPATAGEKSITTTSKPGEQFMPASEQLEYFAGCVYIRDDHKVLDPTGALLKPDVFRAMYSGYTFAMDMTNTKTTKSAWEAFIESQAWKFPKATRTVFRPKRPPLAVFEEEGEPVANCYVPVLTKRRAGDPTPFLDLLGKMLPSPQDRNILLSYMAAVVQYPGEKFQWCPIIQGTEGNGKTILLQAMRHCIGHRYTHFPNARDLENKFNSWISGKLFIGVEEIFVGDRAEMLDALKPLVTNRSIEKQGKGADQTTGENWANFMMTTNHKDAIRINPDSRRWCIFFTAQQTARDLQLFGMHGSYFPHLHRWLDTEGYEIINDYLREFAIPDEFNPAGICVRAPQTSTTREAHEVSAGTIEQEILEAVEIGMPGFRENWISSIMLDNLLQNRRLARFVPPQRRRQLLQAIGYDWHPNLAEQKGRCPTLVLPEAGKPTLYYRTTSIPPWCQTPADVRTRYMQDQGYDPTPNTYMIGK